MRRFVRSSSPLPVFALAGLAALAFGESSAQDGYRLPPEEIVEMVDAPPPPVVRIDPTGKMMLLAQGRSLPTIAELSEPLLRLAGDPRLQPRVHPRSARSPSAGMRLPPRLARVPLLHARRSLPGLQPACRLVVRGTRFRFPRHPRGNRLPVRPPARTTHQRRPRRPASGVSRRRRYRSARRAVASAGRPNLRTCPARPRPAYRAAAPRGAAGPPRGDRSAGSRRA